MLHSYEQWRFNAGCTQNILVILGKMVQNYEIKTVYLLPKMNELLVKICCRLQVLLRPSKIFTLSKTLEWVLALESPYSTQSVLSLNG